MTGQKQPGNSLITVRPKTASLMAEPSSRLPYLLRLSAQVPLRIVSCFASCGSPGTIHFRVLEKSPLSGPRRGLPSWKSCTLSSPLGKGVPCIPPEQTSALCSLFLHGGWRAGTFFHPPPLHWLGPCKFHGPKINKRQMEAHCSCISQTRGINAG